MIALLSPAKNMDFSPSGENLEYSFPIFLEEADYLIQKLKKWSPRQIGKMMNINPQLSDLNHLRYQNWEKDYINAESKASMFAFNGEVYRGLGASDFSDSDISYANKHIVILSGLHGLLRPLDLIQPYRLEMGIRWSVTKKQNNLYKFWGEKVSQALNEMLADHKDKTIINLASNEYWKVIKPEILDGKVVHCQFVDWKNGEFKSVMTWAKQARGMMAKKIVKNKVEHVEELMQQEFNGYGYNDKLSSPSNLVFSRSAA